MPFKVVGSIGCFSSTFAIFIHPADSKLNLYHRHNISRREEKTGKPGEEPWIYKRGGRREYKSVNYATRVIFHLLHML
jgi:hypothetical protein